VALVASVPAFADELVTNGNFATGNFTGWDWFNNQSFTTIEANCGPLGEHCVMTGPVGSDGSLAQNLNTVVGQQYQISFDLASNGDPSEFVVWFGNQQVDFMQNLGSIGWTHFSFAPVIADSSVTAFEVDFRNDPSYTLFTNLSVQGPSAVPEPSTLALLCTGLLGAAGAIRRKFIF
jgi:hypothetical protein